MTDPISDMLTRIRNAQSAKRPQVEIPHSHFKESVARILQREGYVAELAVEGKPFKAIKMKLKYEARRGIIEGLRRVSRPGLRVYVGATDIPRVRGGLGISVLSTSRGVMTGSEARKQNLGGEVLCYIW